MENLIGNVIIFWTSGISLLLGYSIYTIVNPNLEQYKIYHIGPNPNLYILGFCVDNYYKYTCIVAFCFINSIIRTLNRQILESWISNQVQDVSKIITVSYNFALKIQMITTIYTWFDYFMYINILLTQIDMFIIELVADIITNIFVTNYYFDYNKNKFINNSNKYNYESIIYEKL